MSKVNFRDVQMCMNPFKSCQVKSLTVLILIVSKQLHSDNMKIIQHRPIILLNVKYPQLSKPKAKATVARN